MNLNLCEIKAETNCGKRNRAIVTCSLVLSDRINYNQANREFREIEKFYTLYVTAKNK